MRACVREWVRSCVPACEGVFIVYSLKEGVQDYLCSFEYCYDDDDDDDDDDDENDEI